MVESLVQGGSGTVAVTGYLKSNDKREELELVSLLPEDITKLMGRDGKGADWESALPGVQQWVKMEERCSLGIV